MSQKKWTRWLALILLTLATAAAQAGDCRLVDKQQADALKRLIQPGMVLFHYCQSCDTLIVKPLEVHELRIESRGPGDIWVGGRAFGGDALRQAVDHRAGPLYRYVARHLADGPGSVDQILAQLQTVMGADSYEVFLNDTALDMTSLYLALDDGRYENLGYRTGCTMPGVARMLSRRDG